MNRADVEKACKQEYEYASRQVLQYGTRAFTVPKVQAVLEALLAAEHAVDVSGSIYLGYTWGEDGHPQIVLSLRDGRQDSPFVREVAKLLGLRFAKTPEGDGISCVAELDVVQLKITSYLPASCHIEYEEVYVPGHQERRPKVVCLEGEESDG